jgi:hypothetical protein
MTELTDGGVVCIAGTVEPLEPLVVAPLTGRPCVYWALTISETTFELATFELANLEGGASFLVVDGRSRARVIPDGARLVVATESRLCTPPHHDPRHKWSALGYEPPPMSNQERAMYEAQHASIRATSRVRFTEYVIAAGDAILVRGASESEPDPHAAEAGYREAPTRLVLASVKRTPLLIKSEPGGSSVQAPSGP